MSSDLAVSVRGLSKTYTITHNAPNHTTMAEALVHRFRAPFQRQKRETFWALKEVSFDIRRGEAVGIIGRNGAGKSTLLKILSEITEPSQGEIRIFGRVGSLLEVGTGFHQELTGRENIYLNGAILGMRKGEIKRKFDEIVEFAGVEQFLDTPVKRYSSGMYVKLAFAVASHLESDILVVDEVLAVGDAAFQKKCLGKMGDVTTEGRTVLFVSHNMTAVQSLCNRAIWLDRGTLQEDGEVHPIISKYLQKASANVTEQVWTDVRTAPGNDKVRLRSTRILDVSGSVLNQVTIDEPFSIEFEYWNLVPGAYLNLSVVLWNEEGTAVFNTLSLNEPLWHGRPFPIGLFRSTFDVPANLLNDGYHRVELYIVQNQSFVLFRDEVLVFEVHELREREHWHGKWIGAVRPNLVWRTQRIDLNQASVGNEELISSIAN